MGQKVPRGPRGYLWSWVTGGTGDDGDMGTAAIASRGSGPGAGATHPLCFPLRQTTGRGETQGFVFL